MKCRHFNETSFEAAETEELLVTSWLLHFTCLLYRQNVHSLDVCISAALSLFCMLTATCYYIATFLVIFRCVRMLFKTRIKFHQ